jgi:hypothetical protein
MGDGERQQELRQVNRDTSKQGIALMMRLSTVPTINATPNERLGTPSDRQYRKI